MLPETDCRRCAQLRREHGAVERDYMALSRVRNRAAGVDGAEFADAARFRAIEPLFQSLIDRWDAVEREIRIHLSKDHSEVPWTAAIPAGSGRD